MSEMTDADAMDLIAEAMSGKEWSADTLDEIAAIVSATGRSIADPFDVEDDDDPAPWGPEAPDGDTNMAVSIR